MHSIEKSNMQKSKYDLLKDRAARSGARARDLHIGRTHACDARGPSRGTHARRGNAVCLPHTSGCSYVAGDWKALRHTHERPSEWWWTLCFSTEGVGSERCVDDEAERSHCRLCGAYLPTSKQRRPRSTAATVYSTSRYASFGPTGEIWNHLRSADERQHRLGSGTARRLRR